MSLRRYFVDPPAPKPTAFRYGFLAVICALLLWNVYIFVVDSPYYHGDPYGSFVISTTLLLNHVAFQFRLPPRLAVAARVLAVAWLAFGLFYICYLSRVLFPLR